VTQENKKRINIYIPNELYIKVTQSNESITDAITHSLELYFSNNQDFKLLNQLERISDLKEQINSLQNQIEVKDKQLMTRDIEVRDLTENLKGQILTIHNLTTKQLPEPKKRWWRIW